MKIDTDGVVFSVDDAIWNVDWVLSFSFDWSNKQNRRRDVIEQDKYS
jgi:hypothetical protein